MKLARFARAWLVCMAVFFGIPACGAYVTSADRAVITSTAITIALCEVTGQECQDEEDEDPDAKRGSYHCWREYDDCMRDGGLRDLASKPAASSPAFPSRAPKPKDASTDAPADASDDSGKDGG